MKGVKKEAFIKMGKGLIRSSGFVSDAGECVPLTHADKILYIYINDRVDLFVRKRKGEYFESHDTIAKETNVSRATVSRLIQKLIEHGVVRAVLQKGGRYVNYKYLSVQPLNLYFKEDTGENKGVVKDEQDSSFDDTRNQRIDFPPAF